MGFALLLQPRHLRQLEDGSKQEELPRGVFAGNAIRLVMVALHHTAV